MLNFEGFVYEMFEGAQLVPSNISQKSFKQNLSMQNSFCDHRNFDSVNQLVNLCCIHLVLVIFTSVLFQTHQLAVILQLMLNSVPVARRIKDHLARCV